MLKRLLLLGLLLGCGGARAGIFVIYDPAASAATNWVYEVRLQADTQMAVGDFFTVYDFRGLQLSAFSPVAELADRTFTLTEPFTGTTPASVDLDVLNDNPSLQNVSVELTGGPLIDPAIVGQGGRSLLIGTLTLTGLTDQMGPPIRTTALTTKLLSNGEATSVTNISLTPAPVPEPTTIGFMGAGLLAVAALALRRRRAGVSS